MSIGRRGFLLFLAGCITRADVDAAKDRDGDGYRAFQAGGDDCDDTDPAVNPGETEVCGNGIDDDCDALVDDVGFGGATFYPDDDHDGFGDDAGAVDACAAPRDHVTRGRDCDDARDDVFPGATEVWYDGIDQDCGGDDDFDQDGDGHATLASGGDDCDDLLGDVHPDHAEVCDNGRDDDCDGTGAGCDWAGKTWAQVAVRIDTAGGAGRIAVGDADGDGTADVAHWAEASGRIDVYYGPTRASALPALTVTLADPAAGHPMSARMDQDLSNDGAAELVVGQWSPGARGRVDVFRPIPTLDPTLGPGDAWRAYQGPVDGASASVGFGHQVRTHGPLGGTSVGSWSTWYAAGGDDECFLFDGGRPAGVGDVVATLRLSECEGLADGLAVSGNTRSLVSRLDFDYHLVDVPLSGDVDASAQPSLSVLSTPVNAEIPALAPDLDADGTTEAVALLEQATPNRLVLAFGPLGSAPSGRTIVVIPDGTASVDVDGAAFGDFDGDGRVDLAVRLDATAGVGADVVAVMYGPFLPGEFGGRPTNFDAWFAAPARLTDLQAGDLDADGHDDLVAVSDSAIHLLLGRGL